MGPIVEPYVSGTLTQSELLEQLHLHGACSVWVRANPGEKNPWTDEYDSRSKEWAKKKCYTDCPVLEQCRDHRAMAYSLNGLDRPISVVLAGTKYKSMNEGYRKPRDRSKV